VTRRVIDWLRLSESEKQMDNETQSTGNSMFARHKARIGLSVLSLGAAALLMPAISHAALIFSVTEPGFPSSTPLSTAGTELNPGGTTTYHDFTYKNLDVTSDQSAGSAELTLDEALITNTDTSPHTISLLIAETDYNTPGGPGSTLSLQGTYSGTAGAAKLTTGSATMTSYADSANEQDPTNPANPLTVASTSSTANKAFNFANPVSDFTGVTFFQRSTVGSGNYSLAGVLSITLSAGGSINISNDTFTFANQVVPEPTSLAMVAAGGLLLIRRRRAGKST
jgi:cytoskeletal protein RodZ